MFSCRIEGYVLCDKAKGVGENNMYLARAMTLFENLPVAAIGMSCSVVVPLGLHT